MAGSRHIAHHRFHGCRHTETGQYGLMRARMHRNIGTANAHTICLCMFVHTEQKKKKNKGRKLTANTTVEHQNTHKFDDVYMCLSCTLASVWLIDWTATETHASSISIWSTTRFVCADLRTRCARDPYIFISGPLFIAQKLAHAILSTFATLSRCFIVYLSGNPLLQTYAFTIKHVFNWSNSPIELVRLSSNNIEACYSLFFVGNPIA